MRVVFVALILAGLTAAVSAQGINLAPADKKMTSEEIEKQKAIDEAYRAAIRKVPDQQRNTDPWAIVRTPEPDKKAAQPKTNVKPKAGAAATAGARKKSVE